MSQRISVCLVFISLTQCHDQRHQQLDRFGPIRRATRQYRWHDVQHRYEEPIQSATQIQSNAKNNAEKKHKHQSLNLQKLSNNNNNKVDLPDSELCQCSNDLASERIRQSQEHRCHQEMTAKEELGNEHHEKYHYLEQHTFF